MGGVVKWSDSFSHMIDYSVFNTVVVWQRGQVARVIDYIVLNTAAVWAVRS